MSGDDLRQRNSLVPPGIQRGARNGRLALHRVFKLPVKKLHELKRFAFAGVINTFIGASLIYTFQALTSSPYLANALGYLIAGAWAYFLHAKFTFKARTSRRSFAAFALISASGYALNVLVLRESLRFLGPYYAQTASIISYAAYSYVMQSCLAFPAHMRSTSRDE